MKTKIIALTGGMGSGKSTVSNYLEKQDYIRDAFAEPLRDMLKVVGLTDESFLAENKNKEQFGVLGWSPRYLMQTLGTEWGRYHIDQEIWVKLLLGRIQKRKHPLVVIDDLRFDNEAEKLLSLPANYEVKIWKLLRKNRVQSNSAHISEKGIDDKYVTHNINNNFEDLNDLFDYVNGLL